MTRLTPVLFALFLPFATAAHAQASADIGVTLELTSIPDEPRPGHIVAWRATVRNHGPAAATRVHFGTQLDDKHCSEQTIAVLAAGEQRTADCSMALPRRLEALLSAAAYTNEQADTDAHNNVVRHWIALETPPDLVVESFPPRVADAGLPFTLRVHYANLAAARATGVRIDIDVPGIAGVLKLPGFCTASGSSITCRLAELERRQTTPIEVELLAPDASARLLPVRASIHGNEDDLNSESNFNEKETRTFRTFFVTSTADAGSGSLRQAMQSANAQCGGEWPCKIAFRIPAAGAKWLTIRPETPLPVMQFATTIDGAMQTAYIGDTNPDGPEIELRGAGLAAVCPTEIRGLVINGAPGSGIQFSHALPCFGGAPFGPAGFDPPAIEHNYIGVDPTGTTAVPNERGIVLERGPVNVRRNVISGNRRSGITVTGGNVLISHNIIGLDRTLAKDLGNGASGIYLGPGSTGTDAIDNYIGFNRHFGVSLDSGAVYSSLRGNSFQANWSLAIDFGLDGPTAEVPDASAPHAPVRRPIITSARYDAATNTTIMEGTSETTRERHEVWIAVYANDEPDPSGYGEGQYYLGEVKAGHDGRFTFTYAGRAPGRWIAATSTRQNIIGFARTPETQGICGCGYTTQTSEFGRTVELQ